MSLRGLENRCIERKSLMINSQVVKTERTQDPASDKLLRAQGRANRNLLYYRDSYCLDTITA